MTTLERVVITAAVVGLVGGVSAEAQTPRKSSGSFISVVRDATGSPVPGAIVSAVGGRTISGTTDNLGRCTLAGLPAGDYLIRVHRVGYAAPNSLVVRVPPGASASRDFTLKLAVSTAASRFPADAEILAAGMLPSPVGTSGEAATEPVENDHDHGEAAWRLRHLRRSVLKDAVDRAAIDDGETAEVDDGGFGSFFGRAVGFSSRAAASLFTDFPFTGQVNLLTTSTFDDPAQLISDASFARGVAYMSLGAAAGRHGDWSVEGAMTQGDVASWIFAGSYLVRAPAAHQYEVGMSYAAQRYRGVNPASLQAVADGSRDTGALYAYDRWRISRTATIVYGARYERYGYLENPLFSPRVAVELTPLEGVRLHVSASRRADAPGSEEFRTAAISNTWLPPQRTFAPLGDEFLASRTQTYDVGLEHDLGSFAALGFRTFYQRTSDQGATIFGLGGINRSTADLHHYYVASAGDVVARGWSVSLNRVVARRVKGSVEYTVTTAHWQSSPDAAALGVWAPSVIRAASERLHDVTTSVETEIPITATRVFALYRINTGYSAVQDLDFSDNGLDARFDVQVTQALPFMNFTSAQWEMLVGVRNLFTELAPDASFYDELLVVRPPKRVVGGLTVRF